MVRRRTPDTDALEVELVEASDDGLTDPPPRPPAEPTEPPAAPRPGGRRRRLLMAGAVAVVVAALAVSQVVEAGRTPTAGVVDGLVGSIPEPPEELWRTGGSYWSMVDGDTVVHAPGDGVTIRDVRTGDVVGERDGSDVGRCEPPIQPWVTAAPLPVVLCTRGPMLVDGTSVMVLTAVAVDDARTMWDHTFETSSWDSWVSVLDEGDDEGGDESAVDVLWTVRDGAIVRMTRLGSVDGAVRWASEVEAEALDGFWVQPGDGVAVVGTTVVVDLATGAERDGDSSTQEWSQTLEMPHPGGTGRFVWSDGDITFTAVAPDGSERFTLVDVAPVGWLPIVSDRADAFGLMTPAGRYAIVDALTGEQLWELADTQDPDIVAYLADVMVVRSGTELRGVDPRTGVERWSTELLGDASTRVVDDRRLITPARFEGGPGLQAIDLETGEEAWRLPLPSPVAPFQAFHVADGVLVVQMESGTIAFATG